jgi:hypothetical protein
MKNIFALLTIILLLSFVSATNAQSQFATKGIIELGGAVSFSSTTAVSNGTTASQSTTLFQFTPYGNYYFIDGFSLGLSPGIDILKYAGSSNSTNGYAIFLVPGYTFTTKSNMYPFIEVLVGYTALSSGSTDLSGISFGAKGGVKLGVGSNGLITVGLNYISFNLSPKGASSRSGYNDIALSFGYSIFISR